MENKESIHYAHPYFSNPLHPITVSLIGCGGTGSLILGRLARMDYVLKQLGHPGLHVKAFDGDIVEFTNPGRQNFLESDIGDYKATNIIQKINFAFGVDWDAENIMIDIKDSGKLNKTNRPPFPVSNIIITCIDTAKFRMEFDSYSKKWFNNNYKNSPDYNTPMYWIDCGNGKDFGQVIMSTIAIIKQPENSKYNCVEKLPSIVDLYGDLLKFDNSENQGMESCSMSESLNKQDLFINDKIAVEACSLLNKLLRNLYVSNQGVMVNQSIDKTIGIPLPNKNN